MEKIKCLQLARIFHTGSSRGAANTDVDNEGDGLRRWLCVYTLPEEDFEINVASFWLPGLRSRIGMKYPGYPLNSGTPCSKKRSINPV